MSGAAPYLFGDTVHLTAKKARFGGVEVYAVEDMRPRGAGVVLVSRCWESRHALPATAVRIEEWSGLRMRLDCSTCSRPVYAQPSGVILFPWEPASGWVVFDPARLTRDREDMQVITARVRCPDCTEHLRRQFGPLAQGGRL